MTGFRLASGGLVDRTQPQTFRFDGQTRIGLAGDTLASALLASGQVTFGRSFKYHRRRGLLTAGPEEPNALVELREGARCEPNSRATIIELFDGLVAHSQNRFPSLDFDVMAVTGLLSPIFAAGFYYKTFMWPSAFWEKLYEPAIRRAAGLGRASGLPDPDTYEKAFAFCDVLVIGAGPAGLAAALAAGRAGARVILADEDFRFGGRLNAERQVLGNLPAAEWAAMQVAELRSLSNVTLMARTSVVGLYDGNGYVALERVADHLVAPAPGMPRQRLWQINAKRAVLATGSLERPVVFAGNDLPGVTLASAVRTYLNRFAVAPGRRAVLFTATDDGWQTAHDLISAGVEVAAVVDPRPDVSPELSRALPAHLGSLVRRAYGNGRVEGVEIVSRDGAVMRVASDVLAVSGGHSPNLGIATHLNHRPRWSEAHLAFVPDALPPGLSVAGSANGSWALGAVLAEGAARGAEAAVDAGFTPMAAELPDVAGEHDGRTALWKVSGGRGKAFVDQQNDVTDKDIALAAREGFVSVEHLKRYTTLGMATDQGKTSNVVGLALLAELTGKSIAATGSTRARPPAVPVALGALAGTHRGKHFRPTRLTPSHAWAAGNGASFVEAGQWLRAQWYARPGETDWLQSVSREVSAVRDGVGFCDVSTLGKIALEGPDVGAFLDRVYCNTFSTLAIGKARYGLMLREDGFVMDDGTVARLDDRRYVMSTTTANAAKVMQHLEFCHQVLWPELDLAMSSITEQWAQFSIAGPKSRLLLEALFDGAVDVSDMAFPYMGAREVQVGTLPVRLFRLSFSGERAYEIAVPANRGAALVAELVRVGAPLGLVPYGTEALGVMRIEKGHVAGNEINGQTVARDLGLGKMMSQKKDYIGRSMAQRPALVAPERPTLAGFVAVDPKQRFGGGAHLLEPGAAVAPQNDLGFITSVAFSPSLDRWIGLGLIANAGERLGQQMRGYDPMRGRDTLLEVVSPVFLDPEGARLHA